MRFVLLPFIASWQSRQGARFKRHPLSRALSLSHTALPSPFIPLPIPWPPLYGLADHNCTACTAQEIAFFDVETVGDLTSRLGSDCQQV